VPFSGPHSNILYSVAHEPTLQSEQYGYGFLFAFIATVAVFLAVSTQYANVTRHPATTQQERLHLCIASCGKNHSPYRISAPRPPFSMGLAPLAPTRGSVPGPTGGLPSPRPLVGYSPQTSIPGAATGRH